MGPESPLVRAHRSLRLAMCQLLSRLLDYPAGLADEREQLVDDLDGLLYLCEAHAAQEAHALFGALDREHAALSHGLREARRTEEALLDRVREAYLSLIEAQASETDRASQALTALWQSYSSFVAHALADFEREEMLLETKVSLEARPAIYRQLEAALGPDERISMDRASQLDLGQQLKLVDCSSRVALTDAQVREGLKTVWSLLSDPEQQLIERALMRRAERNLTVF